MDMDALFMQRALQLASNGLGNVSPNPMVGCVIVHQNRIIGEGYHQKYGQAHAEVNAILSVENKELLPNSTLYVTLEPCNHFGKTPPCADLILKHKMPKVIVCNLDPNPIVAGIGIEKLKNAGVDVQLHVLEKEGKELNKRFFTYHVRKKPYILLKWAQTNNRFLARSNFDSRWISNAQSRQLVHQWRAQEDAILVGFNTALHDNPALTVRHITGKNPVRILLDPLLEIPTTHQLYNNDAKTIVFNSFKHTETENIHYIHSPISPASIVQHLYELQIQSVIVEGGSKTLHHFLDANLWDEARIFTSKASFEHGIAAPHIHGKIVENCNIVDDNLQIIYNIV